MAHPEDELFELLKLSAPETQLENDIDKTTVGVNHLYEEPEGRSSGDTNAPWGEKGPTDTRGNPDGQQHSSSADAGHKEVRQGLIDTLFANKKAIDQAEQAFMSQNFQHVAGGSFSAHSVHLQSKSLEKISHPRSQSLMERVLKTTGRI
jgi:hypothetical protein